MSIGHASTWARRATVVGALVMTSAIVSSWRAGPDAPAAERLVVRLVPPIHTNVYAQFVTTGCTGSANGTFGTNSQPGTLGITMNDLKLIDFGADKTAGGGDDSEVDLLPAPAELNFAGSSGSNVGSYISNATVANGEYEAIQVTMDSTFRILCGVTVTNPAACNGAPAGQYLTKGGSSNTSPDGIGGAASVSSLSIGAQQPFNLTLQSDTEPAIAGLQPPPIITVSGGAVTKNLTFSASGACELWSIGGGNYKVMPASQVAQAQ